MAESGGGAKVQAVIFDYGGVLRREDGADFDEYAAGWGLPAGWLWAAFHDIPEYVLSRTGQIGAAEYRAAVLAQLGRWLSPADAEEALAGWERIRARDLWVEPEMDALLDRLRGRVRLGMLSNAGRGARERLAREGVVARFDEVVCSGDVGLAKPDPEIFRLAASRLGVEPETCAFVDDTLRHVEGARAVGMRAHHYHRKRHAELLAFLGGLGLLHGPGTGSESGGRTGVPGGRPTP